MRSRTSLSQFLRVILPTFLEDIKNLKTGKSTGTNGLISQFFKSCPEQICPYLTTLFNAYFEHSYLPPE